VIVDSAAAAAASGTIDLVAASLDELPALLQGRRVTLADGSERELNTLGQVPRTVVPTAWEQLRLFLADPTVAFVLFVLGAIAIIAELANPGSAIFAGIGGVLLAAAVLGSFIVLPVQPLAVAALVGAFALIAADLFVPSHGLLTTSGLALLVIGALNLIDPVAAPGAGVTLWAIVAVALSVAVVGLAGLYLIVKGQRRPVATGREALVGALAEVRQPLDPEGLVFVEGALWRAVSTGGTIPKGSWVKVTAVDGLRLIVQQLE
jgi:membrane-bound serine protease (ClpP class)